MFLPVSSRIDRHVTLRLYIMTSTFNPLNTTELAGSRIGMNERIAHCALGFKRIAISRTMDGVRW